ncbi:hypothetical protein TWF481_002814 [Arthrobotrys musiformis]|uniref:Uncharacterized protein n=1 Tax=Arthrobotrys musiformis TaxID=47236 RepID=A0AAV9VSJ1_9PEZI
MSPSSLLLSNQMFESTGCQANTVASELNEYDLPLWGPLPPKACVDSNRWSEEITTPIPTSEPAVRPLSPYIGALTQPWPLSSYGDLDEFLFIGNSDETIYADMSTLTGLQKLPTQASMASREPKLPVLPVPVSLQPLESENIDQFLWEMFNSLLMSPVFSMTGPLSCQQPTLQRYFRNV